MIGVIVWSSAVKRKAVIWCEDQGPLAYLHGLDNVLGGDEWPVTGAMVALDPKSATSCAMPSTSAFSMKRR
ncbi:hypothetical protein QWZ10_02135 [Paracoccus cavernae]|uniref:Uncharacterized protein n=1 Tax=Paracoccus cavernae TaxID=1571207 RepID=A0ABT8D4Q9_9RHOB|nr:hypothetical protein [Paracoccus cavernae]